MGCLYESKETNKTKLMEICQVLEDNKVLSYWNGKLF